MNQHPNAAAISEERTARQQARRADRPVDAHLKRGGTYHSAQQATQRQQGTTNGPSEASVNRLVRSSAIMFGDQPTEAKVREWAAANTQRVVSDRITAIEDMP